MAERKNGILGGYGRIGRVLRRRSLPVVLTGVVVATVGLAVPATATASSTATAVRGVSATRSTTPVGTKMGNGLSHDGFRAYSSHLTLGGPTGRRYVSYSSNWSGLGATTSSIEGAEGAWTVPAVKATTKKRYSASWVGVDGLGNRNLIQTGTGQDTTGLKDFAWVEILPAASKTIEDKAGKPAPVKPGDKMIAYVQEISHGTWTIAIEDVTQKWSFSNSFAYKGAGDSFEFIEEAPTINGVQSVPADFGSVPFSGTAVYADGSGGLGWYSTAFTASSELAIKQHGKVLARASAPSAPSKSGQHFTDTYVAAK
jgi:hypothetical protein